MDLSTVGMCVCGVLLFYIYLYIYIYSYIYIYLRPTVAYPSGGTIIYFVSMGSAYYYSYSY